MAARKVTLSLGLVIVPARLEKAVDEPVTLKTLCVGEQNTHPAHDALPISMPKTCPSCGPITDFTSLKKGVPSGTGFAVVSQEDLASVKADTSEKYKGKINLVPHDADSFFAATAQGSSLSYLYPEDAGADHYQLIVKLIAAHPEFAFVTMYTPVSRAGLYVARLRDGVLVMEERVLHERLRPVPAHPEGTANEALFTQFEMILPTMVTEFAPDTYTDDYAAAVADLAAKSTESVVTEGAGPKPATVVGDDDLLAQLADLAKQAKPKAKKKKAS